MFSILRYPLFLSLIVDFAAALQLSWSNGTDVFYVGKETPYVSWIKGQSDPSGSIVLYVTDQDLSKVVSKSYIAALEDGSAGNLPIQIPQSVGNFSISAYANDSGQAGPPTQPLATLQFTVQLISKDTHSTTPSSLALPGPTSISSSINLTLNIPTVAAPSAGPQSATPSQVTNLSTGPNKSIIIGSVVGGFLVLVLLGFIFVMFRRHRKRMESQKALQLLPSPNYLPTSEMVNALDHSIKLGSKPPAVRSRPPIDTDGDRIATGTVQMMVPRREDDLISTSHGSTAPPLYTSRAQSMITYIVPRIFRRHSM